MEPIATSRHAKIANENIFINRISSITDHYHPRMKVVRRSWLTPHFDNETFCFKYLSRRFCEKFSKEFWIVMCRRCFIANRFYWVDFKYFVFFFFLILLVDRHSYSVDA